MDVSFTLHQVTSVLDGPVYRVKNEVTAATNASPAVFVFKTSTQVFDHYAAVQDMNLYPDNRPDAITGNLEFYRQDTVQRDWPTAEKMYDDVNLTLQRVQLLASDLEISAGNVEIDQTTIVQGQGA